ncbi:MAG: cytochrome c oxidase subunit 3 [Candidatus Dormibacteraceae bacterium]
MSYTATARQAELETPPHPAMRPGMMGMFIFLASEVMFFGSLFAMYFYMYGSHLNWPPSGTRAVEVFPLPTINTVVLITSGVTMHISHTAIQRGNRRRYMIWLLVTIILGAAFECGQALEFTTANFNLTSNQFSSAFFTMTGFHGLHVFGGLVFLCLVLFRSVRGQFNQEHHVGVAACAIYWHFVDLVWVFLFTILYIGIAFVS